MPSGILCSVTASTIIVVRASLLLGPSACLAFRCRCGIAWSSKSRNKTPAQKPIKAGRNAQTPMPADCSIAGISRLQTDAATITPAAKPLRAFWTFSLRDFRIKNTQPEPRAVPKKGIIRPRITVFIVASPLFHQRHSIFLIRQRFGGFGMVMLKES